MLLCLAMPMGVAAQDKPAPPTWHELEGTDGDTFIQTAGRLGDGWYVAGWTSGGDRLFVTLSRDGKGTRWPLGHGRIVDVAAAPDGGLYLIGTMSMGAGGDAWFGKVDASGKLVAEYVPATEVGGDLYRVVPRPGGGALMVGVYNPTESGVSHGWVVAVDDAGKELWQQRLGEGSYHYLTDLAVLGDGTLLAVGAFKGTTYRTWFVRLKPDTGERIDSQFHETGSWEGLTGLAPLGGDRMLMVGTTSEEQGLQRSVGKVLVLWAGADGRVEGRREVGDQVIGVGRPVKAGEDVVILIGAQGSSTLGTSLHLARVPAVEGRVSLTRLGEARSVALDWSTLGGFVLGVQDGEAEVILLDIARGVVDWCVIRKPLQ